MRIVIVGGGLVGSATAWALREAGCDVVVLERADRIGGLLRGGVAAVLGQVGLQPLQCAALFFHAGVAGGQHGQRGFGTRRRAGETGK